MRYLIVKLAAIGDVIMTSTLLASIRAGDPAARITWLCGTGVADLVRLFEGVDEVIVADEVALLTAGVRRRAGALATLWRALCPRAFDVTLLAHADSRYRMLLLPVRTGRLRRLHQDVSPRTLPIPGRYFGDEYARLLEEGRSRGPIVGRHELARLRDRPSLRVDPATIGVVLAPGGTRNLLRENALRRWPVERYRELAASLLAAGHPVTLVGDAFDAWVRPHFAGLDVRDEIGRHDLPGTLDLLRAADLVIVHDTGVLHLARLAGAPVVALFGPTMPTSFLAGAANAVALWGGADLACRPCYNGRDYAACADNVCMQRIAVADVMHRAMELLVARHAVRAAAPTSA